MANIHLVAIGKTVDWKQYGYNCTLNIVAKELESLATTGIDVIQENGNIITVYACLTAVNGDNLGRHTILGLVESFRATRFCAQCMAHQDEIQEKFLESDFHMRTKEDYENQLKQVVAAKSSGVQQHYDLLVKDYGIKGACALNNNTGWHLTNNKVADLMHDFLEGVGQFEVKLVLYHLVEIHRVLNMEELKRRIGLFAYGITDVKNRPREILKLKDVAKNHALKQTALDFWCLFRLLPLMISDLVPPGNAYSEFYLDLRRIADILFSQKWTKATATYYGQIYAEHLSRFKQLFPDFKLIPKHHMLLHYGTYAIHSGPPYKAMVAPEEMKGNYFKRTAHVMCNFVNVPYSLAKKHQFFAFFNVVTGNIQRNRLEIMKTKNVWTNTLPMEEEIASVLELEESEEIIVLKRFKFRGQEYRTDQILPLCRDVSGTPMFGLIIYGISKDFTANSLYFLCQLFETVNFEHHKWCYLVKRSENYKLISFHKLLDYHPLDIYPGSSRYEFEVCPRYQL